MHNEFCEDVCNRVIWRICQMLHIKLSPAMIIFHMIFQKRIMQCDTEWCIYILNQPRYLTYAIISLKSFFCAQNIINIMVALFFRILSQSLQEN